MSKRLMGIITEFLVKEKGAHSLLAAAVGKDTQTVKRWVKNGRIPDAHDRYLVALACGSSEGDAIQLANDDSEEAARTA